MIQRINQYDEVLLKDGREGCVVEEYEQQIFDVDIGDSMKDWDNITVKREDIARVIRPYKRNPLLK